MDRGRRRTYKGFVLSSAMEKTITIQTTTLVKHPRYQKYIRRMGRLMAHDEKGEAKQGDLVEVMESRPLSKNKHFRLVKVFRAAPE